MLYKRDVTMLLGRSLHLNSRIPERPMHRVTPHVLVTCLVLACSPEPERAAGAGEVTATEEQRKAVEDTIRKLVESSIAAQNKGDMQSIRAYYASSAVSIQSGQIMRDIDALFAQYGSMVKIAGDLCPKSLRMLSVLTFWPLMPLSLPPHPRAPLTPQVRS